MPFQVLNVYSVFRNTGCGALLFFEILSKNSINNSLSNIAVLNNIVIEFESIQSFLLLLMTFVLFIFGAMCVALGRTLVDAFPKRYLERQIELKVNIIKSENDALLELSRVNEVSLENYYGGIGFGIFWLILDLCFVFIGNYAFGLSFAVFGIFVLFISLLGLLWHQNKFRVLVEHALGT